MGIRSCLALPFLPHTLLLLCPLPTVPLCPWFIVPWFSPCPALMCPFPHQPCVYECWWTFPRHSPLLLPATPFHSVPTPCPHHVPVPHAPSLQATCLYSILVLGGSTSQDCLSFFFFLTSPPYPCRFSSPLTGGNFIPCPSSLLPFDWFRLVGPGDVPLQLPPFACPGLCPNFQHCLVVLLSVFFMPFTPSTLFDPAFTAAALFPFLPSFSLPSTPFYLLLFFFHLPFMPFPGLLQGPGISCLPLALLCVVPFVACLLPACACSSNTLYPL